MGKFAISVGVVWVFLALVIGIIFVSSPSEGSDMMDSSRHSNSNHYEQREGGKRIENSNGESGRAQTSVHVEGGSVSPKLESGQARTSVQVAE
jgi:hypothetical protein